MDYSFDDSDEDNNKNRKLSAKTTDDVNILDTDANTSAENSSGEDGEKESMEENVQKSVQDDASKEERTMCTIYKPTFRSKWMEKALNNEVSFKKVHELF